MASNQVIPRDKGFDHTLSLLKEGYLFIPNRMRRYQSSIIITRIMGRKTICLSGKEAAKVFYNDTYFKRHGATPARIQKTLFGKQAVQSLDGREHQKRKQLFMDLLSLEYEQQLLDKCTQKLERQSKGWEKKSSIILFEESKKILFESVCEWAAVPYSRKKEEKMIEDFGYMIYSFGRVGSFYRRGKRARKRVEHWIQKLIIEVRTGRLIVGKNTPLYQISRWKNESDELVKVEIAARELINLLRPIIAIATYITFAAVALYENPQCKAKLRNKDPQYLEMFCQEVRRYYPFSPFVGAKVKKNFRWRGCEFKKDTLVLLELYGHLHDQDIWNQPYAFNPDRFCGREKSLYDFMPQGGGDILKGHRCAGDRLTLKVMEVFTDYLVNRIEYEVPNQDISIPLNQIPTLPKSGFVMSKVSVKVLEHEK